MQDHGESVELKLEKVKDGKMFFADLVLDGTTFSLALEGKELKVALELRNSDL